MTWKRPNPSSGKDICRMVAYGSSFDNNEKLNIVRRVVLGMDAMGGEGLRHPLGIIRCRGH